MHVQLDEVGLQGPPGNELPARPTPTDPGLSLAQESQGGSHLDTMSLLREGSEETLPQTLHHRDEAGTRWLNQMPSRASGKAWVRRAKIFAWVWSMPTTSAMK